MLPKTIQSRKARWVWIVMLALSPLAYVAGSSLIVKYDPDLKIGFTIDRQSAVEAAAQYAASKGIDVTGWDSLLHISPVTNLHYYYHLDQGKEREMARRLSPEVIVGVRFISPDHLESLEVELGPNGRPLGYSRSLSRQREVGAKSEPETRQIALNAVKSRLSQQGIEAAVDLKLEESADAGVINRKYSWKWPFGSLPELTLNNEVAFRGGVLTRDSIDASIDPEFARSRLHTKSIAKIVFTIAFSLLIAVVLIFSLYRFIQRVKQKEISYSRIALVTAIFASALSLFTLLTDVAIYSVAGQPDISVPGWMLTLIITFSATMSYVLMGLFLGLAYGSGEGDLRESYPGKLTSLDALITGKLFSRNVSRSYLIGLAMGGWACFLANGVLLPWLGKPGFGEDLGVFDPWFGRFPWLSAVLVGPMHIILITIIGILIPLPFLHRRFRSKRLVVCLSAVFVWLASLGPYMSFRPWAPVLLVAAANTVVILYTFFSSDLFASIVCIAVPTFWRINLSLVAQPSRRIHEAGILSLVLTAASLLIALVFYFKGRLYREDEVRPIYAKHLAERVSMQVEVSAAREAQRRLMPDRVPSLRNFSIAARCHPAHEVGGDFYDLFELELDKLGILIAEGGGKGLGSALSIAFAKGFLMPKILGNGQSDNSPTEVIRSLQDRLSAMLEGEAGVSLAYAVIDSNDGTLRYSRVGPNPVIMIANDKTPGELTRPKEREIKFNSSRNLGGMNSGISNSEISVIEGSYSLSGGDSVALLTDGILKNWASNNSTAGAELSKILINVRRADSNALQESLQEALEKSVAECAKRARKQELDDDLTVVLIRMAQDNEVAAEVNNE